MSACRLISQTSRQSSTETPSPLNGSPTDYFLEDNYCSGLIMDGIEGGGGETDDPDEDVYAQLAAKERDLILAAELGNALLEKNEDLTRKNDQLTEEYTLKIDELTQERHSIRLKLENLETEYNATVKELQYDISQLKQELEEQQNQSRQADRTRAQISHELNQQNERLTDQLKKAAQSEEQLQQQVFDVQAQLRSRRNSMHEHVHQIGILRQEIQLLSDKKTDLERRIASLSQERASLVRNLEESQERILALERQALEQEQTINRQSSELEQLTQQNSQLSERVEELSIVTTSSDFEHSTTSLMSELESSQAMCVDSSSSADVSPVSGPNTPGQRATRPNSLHVPSYDDDDIECDDVAMAAHFCSSSSDISDIDLTNKRRNSKHNDTNELRQDFVGAYGQLCRMVMSMQSKQDQWLGGELGDITLSAVLTELRSLMQELANDTHRSNLSPEEQSAKLDHLEVKCACLEKELELSQQHMNELRATVTIKDDELCAKTLELQDLAKKLESQQEALAALQRERDELQDDAAGITKDEIVDQARSERDSAIQSRNAMEVELARTKLDLMSLDSQLMAAVQQKVRLSQQLEQWQIDMHNLLDMTMVSKLQQDKEQESLSAKASPATTRRRKSPFPWS